MTARKPEDHIKNPYTLAEIKTKIASNDYNAEMLLQYAMLLLDGAALSANVGEPVAWMGTHDKTDLYYHKPPQADVVPLYTTPQPTQAQAGAVPLSDDTERLEWLLWKLPGDALRYVVGDLADTSSGAEFRAAIDAAMRCFCCSKLGDEIEIPKELT